MVKLRPNAWFEAEFPDDTVYDQGGDELQFAGQGVARVIADVLAARGYRVEEPGNEFEHGWSFNAFRQKQRFWLRVAFIPDDYVLHTKDMAWRLWPNDTGFIGFLTDLDAGLKSEPRFRNLRWWAKRWPPTEAETFRSPIPEVETGTIF